MSDLNLAPGHPPFNILRPVHLEYRVTDLARAGAFYVDLLGFVETARDRERLYLRGYEERDHHSLVLRCAASPGAAHVAYRVAAEEDLDRIARLAKRDDLPVKWVEEEYQGRTLRIQDPAGLPVEFVHRIDQVERLLQRFDLYRGAFVMRLDHFNCQVADLAPVARWYQHELGFGCSEYWSGEDPSQLTAIWLHRKQNVHDLALMTGTGPRVHHAGFWVQDPQSVLRACDILAGAKMHGSIERGPGRHGLGNAFFLYLRDPDGNRIELYTGDYMIADPDWKPIRWAFDDPQRATFWGMPAPASWFNDASPVESIEDGSLIEPRAPRLRDKPPVIT